MRSVVRRRILEKFNHKCVRCGSKKDLQVDHIIPLSKGGRHNEENFQILCKTCNLKKGSKLDIHKFFKKGDGKNFIYISRELLDIIPYLAPSEFKSITAQMLNDLCQSE